ncbi:MAG TPA: molybdopterin cofactor-binding domain-containing protein [Alphaproteobacteria bacterium]|jgi:CO/xanthine dehydrogenase Mo-binding subunit
MSEKKLPGSLEDDARLDSWLSIDAGETVTLKTGKTEFGQGIKTAIAQIGADELDVSLARVRVQEADSALTADEGLTAGSESVQQSGIAMRYAAAHARRLLLEKAAARLGIDIDDLTVEDGMVSSRSTNSKVSYWELMAGQPFGVEVSGEVAPRSAGSRRLAGKSVRRLDIPAKLHGGRAFVQDVQLPDMLHGRVLHPPAYGNELVKFDAAAIAAMPGVVKVVQDGRFLAVIAAREDQAVRAWEAMREATEWRALPTLPNEDMLSDWLVSQDTDDMLVENGTPIEGDVPDAVEPEGAAQTLEAFYSRPYQMHASIGPSCAVALFEPGSEGVKLTIWQQNQGVFPQQAALATAFGMAKDSIRCIHVEGAGVYGHNGSEDAAMDAAMLARALPDRPVRLQWMREDEHRWEPYGSAMVVALQASLDEAGTMLDWNCDIWTQTHSGRPRAKKDSAGFVAAWHREDALPAPVPADHNGKHGGGHRGATPYYTLPGMRVVKHFVKPHPFRTSSLRALGTFCNVFAQESFVDELAHAAGRDPLEFRLAHLKDARARAVIEKAAAMASWDPKSWGNGHGQGLAFHRYKNGKCYVAVVIEADVDEAKGAIAIPRAWIAADAGEVINPDGAGNQLEGGFLQAMSQTLKEAVRFDATHVTSTDWESYPILTFREAPEIEVAFIDRPNDPPLGVGEGTAGPTPGAIANAVRHAIGVRLRELPLTPERVRKMIVAAERGA